MLQGLGSIPIRHGFRATGVHLSTLHTWKHCYSKPGISLLVGSKLNGNTFHLLEILLAHTIQRGFMVPATSFVVTVPSRNFVSPERGGGFLLSQDCLLLSLRAVSETPECPVVHGKGMHWCDKCTGVCTDVLRELWLIP